MRNSEKGGTNDKGNGTEIDGERTKNAPRVPQPFVTCLHFPPFPKKKSNTNTPSRPLRIVEQKSYPLECC